MQKRILILTLLILIFGFTSYPQRKEQVLYKQIDTTKLFMNVYFPKNMDSAVTYPAMVFFFGGGWISGDIKQFEPHAKYFSERGMICFLVDYRVKSKNQTTPFESLKDAKSAIRYIRKHAEELHVDTSKIVASGGSSGGQLAAATALIKKYNEIDDDLSISCKPNALVLFNPVIDNGPGGYGYDRIGNEYKDLSPLHNITSGAPPVIIFQGTTDKLIPLETIQYFKKVMEKVNSRCDLKLFEGESHGFFNYQNFNNYKETVFETDQFLRSLGYLHVEPQIKIE